MATRDEAIQCALAMPQVETGLAWGQTDYRVSTKVFMAFTVPDRVTLKLDQPAAEVLAATNPETYQPHRGYFGSAGWVRVRFADIGLADLQELIGQSWSNVAPRRIQASQSGVLHDVDKG